MDTVKPIVRRAESRDAAAVARLSAQLGYPMSETEARERIGLLTGLSGHGIFVAELGKDVVGFAHMGVKEQLVVDRQAELLALVVDERYRGLGLGGVLLRACETWTIQEGCPHLVVRSGSQRTRAHEFYMARGYGLIKEQRVFVKDFAPDGEGPHKPV